MALTLRMGHSETRNAKGRNAVTEVCSVSPEPAESPLGAHRVRGEAGCPELPSGPGPPWAVGGEEVWFGFRNADHLLIVLT